MKAKSLRSELIRLAYTDPALKPHLLPMLKTAEWTPPLVTIGGVVCRWKGGTYTTMGRQAVAWTLLRNTDPLIKLRHSQHPPRGEPALVPFWKCEVFVGPDENGDFEPPQTNPSKFRAGEDITEGLEKAMHMGLEFYLRMQMKWEQNRLKNGLPIPQNVKTAAKMQKKLTREEVEGMGGAEINRSLDLLDKESSRINDELLETGRGHERPSETRTKTDPLSLRFIQTVENQYLLRDEITRRYGPGAPSRLPRGYGPIKKLAEDSMKTSATTRAQAKFEVVLKGAYRDYRTDPQAPVQTHNLLPKTLAFVRYDVGDQKVSKKDAEAMVDTIKKNWETGLGQNYKGSFKVTSGTYGGGREKPQDIIPDYYQSATLDLVKIDARGYRSYVGTWTWSRDTGIWK